MAQTIAANKVTLYDLEQRFQLEQAEDPSFFSEWQADFPARANWATRESR